MKADFESEGMILPLRKSCPFARRRAVATQTQGHSISPTWNVESGVTAGREPLLSGRTPGRPASSAATSQTSHAAHIASPHAARRSHRETGARHANSAFGFDRRGSQIAVDRPDAGYRTVEGVESEAARRYFGNLTVTSTDANDALLSPCYITIKTTSAGC